MMLAAVLLPVGAAGANPVLPATSQWLVMVPLALVIALPIAAVISLVGDRYYTVTQRLLWLLLVVSTPFLGPVLWFVLGRTHVFGQDDTATTRPIPRPTAPRRRDVAKASAEPDPMKEPTREA